MGKLKPYVDFLFEVGVLERTPRTGFRHLGGMKQSISEHLLRTAYIGFVLASLLKEKGEDIDVGRVVENCLFHDLGEARATDLDYISQKYSSSDELKAIQEAVKDLSFGKHIIDSFKETEGKTTKEGIVAKDADQLELLFSLKELVDNGNQSAEKWFPPLLKRLKTDLAKELADEILNTNSNDWWLDDPDDEYWVTGGKKKNR